MGRNNNKRYATNSSPLISVIIPCFNRKEWIPLTIESLLRQTYTNFEAIFIQDGGEDIDDLLEKYSDKRFRLLKHGENKGLPAARNTGLRNSHGEYISFLDSDDQYMPLALEFRLWNMQKLNADIVYTRSLRNIYNPVIQGNLKQYQLVKQELYWNSQYTHGDQILYMNVCPCCNPLFSRKCWEETGYWLDETLNSSEDMDFWIALSRKNYFHNLELVDAECSYRNEKDGQMTGSIDFSRDWIKLYKRWRHTANDIAKVTEIQNNTLKRVGINPADYGL